MKKTTITLALSTIILGALAPTGQVIADTYLGQNPLDTSNIVQSSNQLTNSPTKVVTGVPANRTYLEADTVTFNNEFTGTNGDELHMGGQYNDKINISTTFKPTSTLPPYQLTAQEVDGVPGIFVPGGFDIVFETYMSTFNGSQTNFLSPETTTFKVTANGVDISSDFSLSFVNTGLSAGLGLYLTYTPSGDGMLAIGSGLEVELSIDEPDVFPTGGDATYFNIGSVGQVGGGFRLQTEKGILGESIPASVFGDSPATLQPLKLFFGYAPTILGVEDKEIPLNSSFDPMEGVTANDKHDGDVTSALTHSGEVDTTKAGVYPIEYSVTDSDGQTTTATRNITVKAPLPTTGGDVTVKYVDENGTEIHAPQTLSGNVNDAYDASTAAYKLAIDGYTLDESKLPDNATGTFTDQPQTVTYTYKKNEDKSAIIVHDSTLTVGDVWSAQDNFDSALNKKGDKVPFDQIKVEGTVNTSKAGIYKVTYSYDETNTPQVMKAEIGATHQGTTTVTATITVKDKAPVDPGNPGEPTSPTTPSQPDKPSGSGNTNTNTSGNTTVNVSNYGEDSKVVNKTLPETGEDNNSSFIVYGLGILAALLGFITYRGVRRKN